MNKARLAVLAAAMALTTVLALSAHSLSAQPYPPPVGSLTASVAPTPALIGSSVTVSAVVRDVAGNPSPGQEVVFAIASQPGTDASLEGAQSVTKISDADGLARAQLFTGSTPGTIIVEVTSGAMSSQVSVTVQTAAPPPAAVPPTGGAGTADQTPPAWLLVLAAAGGILALGATLLILRRQMRS